MLGVGSPHGADRIGWEVVAALEAHHRAPALSGDELLMRCIHTGELAACLTQDFDRVVVIDAVHSGVAPGTVQRWELPRDAAALGATQFGVLSTHGLGLLDALALARNLQCLPEPLVLYGIEVDPADARDPPGPALRDAVSQVVARVLTELL